MGFFAAFGTGLFEGFNDKMEAEDAHDKQKDLIKFTNSFKDKVIDETEYETLQYTDANGVHQSQDLYAVGDRSALSDEEYKDDRMKRFFQSEYSSPQKMEELIRSRPNFAGALIRLGDKFAYEYHNNSRNENNTTGVVRYKRGIAQPDAQASWHKQRFNQIARGLVPLDDYGLPMLKIKAVNGDYYKKNNASSIMEGWGYETKEALEKAVMQVKVRTADARTVEEILGDNAPSYWKMYAKAEPIFKSIASASQYMNADNRDALYEVFNGRNADGTYVNPLVGGNSGMQMEILRMAAPEFLISTFGQDLTHITNPVKYMEETLGIDAEHARAKATSASDAEATLTTLLSQVFNPDGSIKTGSLNGEDVPLYGFPAFLKKTGQALFGAGGMTQQLKSLMASYGMKFENESKTMARLEKRFGKDRLLTGNTQLDAIAEREVLYELLAYQVAAAIQGGTGGRTISDADVANIKKALGIGGLSGNAPMQAKRLTVLRDFMKKIRVMNSGFTRVGGGMKQVVAAGQLHEMILGGDIRDYTTDQFADALVKEMNQIKDVEPLPADLEPSAIIDGLTFALTVEGRNKLTAYLSTGEGKAMEDSRKEYFFAQYGQSLANNNVFLEEEEVQ